jgi:hypothetical protein
VPSAGRMGSTAGAAPAPPAAPGAPEEPGSLGAPEPEELDGGIGELDEDDPAGGGL